MKWVKKQVTVQHAKGGKPGMASYESDTSASSSYSEGRAPSSSARSNGGSFMSNYQMGHKLGEGAFAVVNECTNKRNGKSYAVKVVVKSRLPPREEQLLKYEISLLRELQHPNIVCLLDVYQERENYYLVMEKIKGGELFNRIVQYDHYTEKQARDTCLILFKAVQFLHSRGVVHRDLKPENLLLLSEHTDSEVKIADFGFAKKVLRPNSLTTRCGTPQYVAPEVLKKLAYDTQADMWSLGVIVYIMLGGYEPFNEPLKKDLFKKIREGDYEFHADKCWGSVSKDAKHLVSSLLTVDPAKRLTATQALQNKWINSDHTVLANSDLGGNLEELRLFNAKRKLRAAVNTVIAANRFGMLFKLGPDFVTKQTCEC